MNPTVALAGRVLLATIFIVAGIRKALAFGFVSSVVMKGFPMADVFLAASIALDVIGGILLILNIQTRLVASTLAVYTLALGAIFHGFWGHWSGPPPAFANELNHFLKNLAIAGGLLLLANLPNDRSGRAGS